MLAATGRDESLPPHAERRLSQFADVAATAVASTKARGDLGGRGG